MSVSLLRIAADTQLSLAAAVTVGQTTATLSSATDPDGVALPSGKYGFTVDGDTSAKEYIVCDLVGTALTGIQNISRQGAATTGFANYHRFGATVTITDWAILDRMLNNLTGETGFDSAQALSYDGAVAGLTGNQIPTVNYVLSVVNGGAVTFDQQVVSAQTAGENLTALDFVYLKESDNKWWKVDADTAATYEGVQLGIALATVSADATTSMAISGPVEGFSGLTPADRYYASSTAGGVSTTASPALVGIALSATSILLEVGTATTPNQEQKYFLSATTGMVSMYAGTSVPTGFLACDGSAISRTTYAPLFAVISTSWGVGDGSTTFNVPDLRGCVPVGAGTKTKVATFASRSSNVITVTGLSNAANNEFQTGQAVLYSAPSGAMTGLTDNTTYYLIRTGNLTFSLATSLANAQNGTVIALSSDGTGTQTFTLTLTARTLGQTGGEENHAMSSTEQLAHTHTGVASANSANRTWTDSAGANLLYAGTSNSTGGNAAMNNMQPFGVITYIIKT